MELVDFGAQWLLMSQVGVGEKKKELQVNSFLNHAGSEEICQPQMLKDVG